jgi:hypothetical protein
VASLLGISMPDSRPGRGADHSAESR